jgi:hypothetical protein
MRVWVFRKKEGIIYASVGYLYVTFSTKKIFRINNQLVMYLYYELALP